MLILIEVQLLSKLYYINMPNQHYMRFRDPEGLSGSLYDTIKMKKKTVEGRKGSFLYNRIKVDDYIYLCDRKHGMLKCKVVYINKYDDVSSYLDGETFDNAFGGLVDNKQDALDLYHKYVPADKIAELKEKNGHGFLGIGFEFMKEYNMFVSNLKPRWWDAINDRKKIVEGRPNRGKFAKFIKGDMVAWVNSDTKKVLYTRITDKKHYDTFREMIEGSNIINVLPGVDNIDDGVAVYREYYSEEVERENKVLAIYIVIINMI